MKPIETEMLNFFQNSVFPPKELDYVDAYQNAECFDEYIVNLTHQRPMDQSELEEAEAMYHELTFKYSE